MSDILSDMATINTREIQKNTRVVRNRLLRGETLEWVMGKQVIGYLTPAAEPLPPEAWPDLEARLRSIYGGEHPTEEPAAQVIHDDR
jgi:hypothetical protein